MYKIENIEIAMTKEAHEINRALQEVKQGKTINTTELFDKV